LRAEEAEFKIGGPDLQAIKTTVRIHKKMHRRLHMTVPCLSPWL
jgi:hypothetical protein